MTTAAVGALILLLALSYWRPLRRVRSALGVSHLLATGHVFLVLGWLLGLVFGLDEDQRLASELGPLVAFAAGWVGFAAGTRFEHRVLAAVPLRGFATALGPGVLAAVLVGGTAAALLLATGIATGEAVAAALCIGAAAASSGPTLAAAARHRRAGRHTTAQPVLRMLEFSSGVTDALVIVLALIAFCLFRPPTTFELVSPVWVLAVALVTSAALGVVTWLFLGGSALDDERLLLGLAMLALIAGLGGWLLVAPAAVAAIAAAVLANLPGSRAAILVAAVQRVERPAVVILMAVIGLHLAGPMSWHVLPLIAAMTLVRLGARALVGAGPGSAIRGAPSLSTGRSWPLGLTPQGILGLVIAVSFFHVWQDSLARAVLAAVAAAGLINELIAPTLLLRVLRKVPSGGERRGAG
jgi:hypothetical protein